MKKQYIVRKYVIAENVKEALRQEKNIQADEAWIDPEWQKENANIGYEVKKQKK